MRLVRICISGQGGGCTQHVHNVRRAVNIVPALDAMRHAYFENFCTIELHRPHITYSVVTSLKITAEDFQEYLLPLCEESLRFQLRRTCSVSHLFAFSTGKWNNEVFPGQRCPTTIWCKRYHLNLPDCTRGLPK